MNFCDFYHSLRKLNPQLRIDIVNQVAPKHPDFPIAGLYHGSQYLMAVPHNNVPRYSIEAVNTKQMNQEGFSSGMADGNTGKTIDRDFVEAAKDQIKDLEFCLLSRGYVPILNVLVKKGLVDQTQAEKEFSCTLNTNIIFHPRQAYLDLHVAGFSD